MSEASEEYQKAYDYADQICRFRPEDLEHMHVPENEHPDFTEGFQDRIRDHEIEQDSINGLSHEKLKEKYGKYLDTYGKGRTMEEDKNKDRDRDR